MPSKEKLTKINYQRPPIVAILGHVDHGKTTLLDVIRKTDKAALEHGGITQHIGAYQVEYQGEKITFIDTPGHAAFVKMRSQGVSATDMVVLVVAANDGIKPQTKESINHIKQASTPFLVAINKIDLPQASVDMVKAQLAENDVLVEGYGGDIVCVEVSAKLKKGIDDLLEMILLLGKMNNLTADPNALLEGVVIDSKLDTKKGYLATILVKNGTLKLGDKIYAGNIEAKVKRMIDDKGQLVKQAEPSKPVEVLGFKNAPLVGSKVQSSLDLGGLKSTIVSNKIIGENKAEVKFKIILKADTLGILEAIKTNLPSEVEVIFSDVGQITDSDILLAQSTGAEILAFNVKASSLVKKLAQMENINIKTYKIIYELLEDIEKKVLRILEPTIDENILGEAEIIAEFNMKSKHIAGCKIKKGKINKVNKIHLKRGDKIIGDARITSFQKEKQEITEAKTGDEIGIVISPHLDFKIGDAIISYS